MKHIVTKPWLKNNANWNSDAKELWSGNLEALEDKAAEEIAGNFAAKKQQRVAMHARMDYFIF